MVAILVKYLGSQRGVELGQVGMQPNVQRKVRFWWRYTLVIGLQSHLNSACLCIMQHNSSLLRQMPWSGRAGVRHVGIPCGILRNEATFCL